MATYEITEPTVADVGAILRARTTNSSSEEVGTFDDTTRPTGDQVEGYISQAVDEVITAVGAEFYREEYARNAGNLAAIRAAMTVEQSHFPEQVTDGTSMYDTLSDRFVKGIGSLADAVRDGSPSRKGFFSVPVRAAGYEEPETES
jgi:hypothetical protein